MSRRDIDDANTERRHVDGVQTPAVIGVFKAVPGLVETPRQWAEAKEAADVLLQLLGIHGVSKPQLVSLTPKLSCEHSITIAAKPNPKCACLLQRSLGIQCDSTN